MTTHGENGLFGMRCDGAWRAEATAMAVNAVRQRHHAALSIEDFDTRRKLSQWALSSESHSHIKSMLELANSIPSIASSIEQFDRDYWLAATLNGTLELRNQIFRESKPEDKLTKQLGTAFDKDADAPRWKQFLSEIFDNDDELIDFIQKAVGYSLTGDTSEQIFFLCYGGGSNGKSLFLRILNKLLGDYGGAASFETFDAGKRSEASNDLAALKGKRLVTVIETEQDRQLAEAKVKAVTGQDEISCRFLYAEYFNYTPQFKIWMAMNHKPVIRGTDNGIWRRIRLIPFNQSFEGRREKGLEEKLEAEMAGILNWALEGLKKWQLSGLDMPKAIKEATQEYRRESDSIGQWIDERTHRLPLQMVRASEGYKDYSDWAIGRGERPYGMKNWSQSMVERGYNKGRDRSGVCFFGLELAE